MTIRRTYRNPPIEEAMIELRFAASPDWNITVPGRLYEQLRDAYPGEPQEQRVVQAGIRVDEGAPPSASLQIGEQGTRVLLRSENHRRLVGVGRDVLSVHNLRPYGGWEEDFRPRLAAALGAYSVVATPTTVTRIGLRYINHIVVDVDRVNLADYFAVGFELPDSMADAVSSFFVRIETPLGEEARLATTFASTGAPPGKTAFLLDLDLYSDRMAQPLALADVLPVVDDLREQERRAFEAMIKDPLRSLFDA